MKKITKQLMPKKIASSPGMKSIKETTVASAQHGLKTLPYFQKAVEIEPDFYPAWKQLGLIYSTQMDSENMSQVGNRDSVLVYSVTPPRLSAKATLAGEKALTAFNKATALNPSDAQLYSAKATVLQSLSRHQEAIEAYSQAIKINPTQMDYQFRSRLYCQVGDKQKAEADMKSAEKLGYQNPVKDLPVCSY
jgi:tetratricopeptide (TPR) repeat protein